MFKSGLSVILSIMLHGGVFCSASFAAQQKDSTWRDMEYIRLSEAWLSSQNVAGLKSLPISRISSANAYIDKSDGAFINYYQSDNSYTIGTQVESFYRLNPKVVFSGKIAYENFNGKNMGGSTFINPYENPFDIVEYADSTSGTKKLERYHLIGAVSAKVHHKLALGGKIDYVTANYAKTRDLRHINKLLDMNIVAGAIYTINKTVEIGANYYYKRRIESISFGIYGNTDRQYMSLISFGSFFGRSELFSSSGYTADNTTTPLVNSTHGAALQLSVGITSRLRLFNEFTFKSRNGYFGEQGTNSIVRTEHHADGYEYSGVLSLHGKRSLHNLSIKANYETLSNMENVYRSETEPGGGSSIVYYGQNNVLDGNIINAHIDYTGNLRVNSGNPAWVLKARADYFKREQTVSVYPFYRRQTISSHQFHLMAGRNVIKGKNRYGISLGALYGAGNGTVRDDGSYAAPSDGQGAPNTVDRYLYQEYEYYTAPRVKSEVGLKYSRMLDNGVGAYLQLDYAYTKAFDVSYIGNDFNHIKLTIGCIF